MYLLLSISVHYRTVVRLISNSWSFVEENLSLDFSVFSISGCSRAFIFLNLLNGKPCKSLFICYFAPNLGLMRSVRFRLHFLIGKRSMNKLTIKACPLCGGTHLERTLTCIDHYASGEVFHLCRCRDCGFIFTQDFPVEAEIGRYYETPDYISHSDTRKGAMNSVYHRVRSYMLKRKARLVAHEAHRKTGRLLDIGTGTGYFADTMTVAAGRWKLWKRVRRRVPLPKNTSIWM